MPSRTARTVELTCHPDTPCATALDISASVVRDAGAALAVRYIIEGEIDRLCIPPEREPRFADRLWEHTCCEIFIVRAGLPAYHEFNFSPSGDWAVLAFERYREGGPVAASIAARLAPRITVRRASTKLELDAVIRLDRLSAAHPGGTLALGLSAVVEDSGGSRSYWALRHAPGRPDFHHADGYALELA